MLGLAVSELSARFHAAARYDDMIRVRTTLAEVRSRGITFDYVITSASDGHRLVTRADGARVDRRDGPADRVAAGAFARSFERGMMRRLICDRSALLALVSRPACRA